MSRQSERAFAAAVSGMVNALPVSDILAGLVRDCAEAVGAQAVAILVLDGHDDLGLAASDSASATRLELLQSLDATGPCVDVLDSGVPQSAVGGAEMVERWGQVGEAIGSEGFGSVDAFPLRWHGQVLGGLNVFRSAPRPLLRTDSLTCQAFADVATVVLLHAVSVPADELTARVHRATSARQVVEQAKGVLSELHGMSIDRATRHLEEMAADQEMAVYDLALSIVHRAENGLDHGPGS